MSGNKRQRLETRIHLVAELEKLPRTPAIEEMIAEAKAGEYHDYKNRKYTCGKVAASTKLRAAGLGWLAMRVENGDFDEEADEDDKAEMRKNLPRSAWPVFGLEPVN
jgi:hypothetical protein